MFSNLDQIDISVCAPDTGRAHYYQCDFRDADDINAAPEISVIFALTRVLLAAHEGDDPLVIYACGAPPPAFLHEAVVAAGGIVQVNQQTVEYAGELRPVQELLDIAFAALARRIAGAREHAAVDEALLMALEQEVEQHRPSREDDELGYWTRILELAAVTGELLRGCRGGRWRVNLEDRPNLPFSFVQLDANEQSIFLNVAGRAKRFVDQGWPLRPSLLVSMQNDLDLAFEERRLLVVLRPASLAGEGVVCRPLLEALGATNLPIVVLGYDTPNTFAMQRHKGQSEEELNALFEQALENLGNVVVSVDPLAVEGLTGLAVTGEYAAEKILDKGFMRLLHDRLAAEQLLAGVPYSGVLLVTALQDGESASRFAGLVDSCYQQSRGQRVIWPLPLVVTEGEVAGTMFDSASQIVSQPAPPRRRSLWSRLLGKA